MTSQATRNISKEIATRRLMSAADITELRKMTGMNSIADLIERLQSDVVFLNKALHNSCDIVESQLYEIDRLKKVLAVGAV